MNRKKCFLTAGIFAVLTLILIGLVSFVDVEAIGPAGTKVGLSHINQAVHEMTGENFGIYGITEKLGFLSFLVPAVFAFLGLSQLIKRKRISKIDREILLLGGLYVLILAIYIFFEKVIVNYRPVIMPDNTEPEASFPSSHTMLACTVMGSAIMVVGKYIRQENVQRLLKAFFAIIMVAIVLGRFVSGVHWFTDIIGGIMISVSLLALFSGLKSEK